MALLDPWRLAVKGLLLTLLLLLSAPALANEGAQERAASDNNFGPLITIESIVVTGNTATASEVIKGALPIAAGDQLRPGDAKLAAARYRVLALGFFRTVELTLAKGSQRGQVVLYVNVEERGTVVLNRLYFGNSNATPWWAGIDLGERNFLGTGVAVGGAFVVVGDGNAEGATPQQSALLRASDSAFFGSRFGWHASAYGVNASEPYRVQGEPDDARVLNFEAFDYERIGGRGGLSRRITSLSQGSVGARLEFVHASLPSNPVQTLPSGERRDIDLHLQDGSSRVATVYTSYDRDTRSDPVLPWQGDRLLLHAEFAHKFTGSSYDFVTLQGTYERWWPVLRDEHVISVHLGGGAVFGDVPLFERLHVGDINRMVAPRALGLVTSTTPSLDILNTSTDEITYGEVGGLAEVQYSYKLFRSKSFVYGGEVFVGVGLWTLATTGDLERRDSIPVDLLVDAGLRIDTEIGIFELSMANALGRLPL
jgi:outer membrane protein assembly factor BamA